MTRHSIVRRLVTVALAFVTVVAPAIAQQASTTTKGLIWKVERNGRVGWLVGSLHLLTSDAYPLPDTMMRAFRESDTLVEEVDSDDAASPAFAVMVMAKALYPEGVTLASRVSPRTYELVVERAAKAGLPIELTQRSKPWMLGILLSMATLQAGGFDPELGLDKYFFDEAKKAGKRFRALETSIEQIDFLDTLPADAQEAFLRESVESAEKELKEMRTLAEAWKTGKAEVVDRIIGDAMRDSPSVYRPLIVDRNRRWMPTLTECLTLTRCYIVVGAGHLGGDAGLVSLLRAEGFRVEQQ